MIDSGPAPSDLLACTNSLAQRWHLPADHASDSRPAEEDDNGGAEPSPGWASRDERQRAEQHRDAHDQIMARPRITSIQHQQQPAINPIDTPMESRPASDGADRQRNARAVGETYENIAAQLVGASKEFGAGADRQASRGQAGVAELVDQGMAGPGLDQPRTEREGDEQDDETERKQAGLVGDETAVEVGSNEPRWMTATVGVAVGAGWLVTPSRISYALERADSSLGNGRAAASSVFV